MKDFPQKNNCGKTEKFDEISGDDRLKKRLSTKLKKQESTIQKPCVIRKTEIDK